MSDHVRMAAVVYAKDLSRIAEFYAAVLGVDGAHRQEDHVVLQSSALQLVIQAIPASIARTIEITTPPARRTDTPIKLAFPVDSIARMRATAAELGGQIDSPEHEWQFREDRVCDGYDPEGNVLQLRERLS